MSEDLVNGDAGAPEISQKFRKCVTCAGAAAGGTLLSHIGCLAIPIIAGATGAASTFLHTGMVIASPVIAVGLVFAIEKLRGQKLMSKVNGLKASFAAVTALAATMAISAFAMPKHSKDDAMAWFNGLAQLDRDRIVQYANDADVELNGYIYELKGINALSDEEEGRIRAVIGNACPCTVPGACKIPGLSPF